MSVAVLTFLIKELNPLKPVFSPQGGPDTGRVAIGGERLRRCHHLGAIHEFTTHLAVQALGRG